MGGGLQWFVACGADFSHFLPWCFVCAGIVALLVPYKRRLEIDVRRNALLIDEGSRSKSIPINTVRDIMDDEQGITLKTDLGSIELFHADFHNSDEEKRFLNQLWKMIEKNEPSRPTIARDMPTEN